MDEQEQEFHRIIEQYDCHIMHVGDYDDSDEPEAPFCYSTGLYKNLQHPEILIIGLRSEICFSIINSIRDDVKNGKRRIQPNKYYDGLINAHQMYACGVSRDSYQNYATWCDWFYNRKEVPFVQLIYPTIDGIWPWDNSATKNFKDYQPVLGQKPDNYG